MKDRLNLSDGGALLQRSGCPARVPPAVRQVSRTLVAPSEIVFVDDGSTDQSFALLLGLTREPEVVVASLLRDHGHQPLQRLVFQSHPVSVSCCSTPKP